MERFRSVSNEEKQSLIQKAVPMNTQKRNKWAINIFQKWHEWKKKEWAEKGGITVLNDLDLMSSADLDYMLKDFIVNIRKENKEEYPPNTLR